MIWSIYYHPEVEEDLKCVGLSVVRRIMRSIDAKLTRSPLKYGATLSGNLANFRKFRVGDYRVVYQIIEQKIIVFVLSVGPRRDREIYKTALKRQ